MKKTFNMLFALTVALVVSFTVQNVKAQNQILTTSYNGGTNNAAGASTNASLTAGAFVVPVDSRVVTVVLSGKNISGASTGAVRVRLDRSVDNSVWTLSDKVVTYTASGTTVVQGYSDVDTGGARYWRVGAVENANAEAVTNLTVKVGNKRGL